MKYEIGQTVFTCRDNKGWAMKGEVSVKIVAFNPRMTVYTVEFKDGSFGILDEKNLAETSHTERAKQSELREYKRLKKKYGDIDELS